MYTVAKEIKDVKGELWQMTFTFPTKRARKYSTASALKRLKVRCGNWSVLQAAERRRLLIVLMRFYDVDSGCISVDGDDIRTVTRSSLRKSYTMVLQDTWLFGGTIAENIGYGKERASQERNKLRLQRPLISTDISKARRTGTTLL